MTQQPPTAPERIWIAAPVSAMSKNLYLEEAFAEGTPYLREDLVERPTGTIPPHDKTHEYDTAFYCLTCEQNGVCGMCRRGNGPARVHPVDDAQVEGARQRLQAFIKGDKYALVAQHLSNTEKDRDITGDVEAVLSVLPKLSSGEPKCDECEAENGWHRTVCSQHPRFTVPAESTDDR